MESGLRGENGSPITCRLLDQLLHWMKADTATEVLPLILGTVPSYASFSTWIVPMDCCAFQGV